MVEFILQAMVDEDVMPYYFVEGQAVTERQKLKHLEHVIAVGDADNDESMLRTAGLSVAMGNSLEHIKELCDVVVADNDHDGCAQVIEEYLLK